MSAADLDDETAAEYVESVANHAEPALRDEELRRLDVVVAYLRGEADE